MNKLIRTLAASASVVALTAPVFAQGDAAKDFAQQVWTSS